MANDLKRILGKHLIYTYDNGWQYEMYVKNANTIDYRIHSGIVAGRWVKDQTVHLMCLSKSINIFKVSWTEPTGTSVSVVINLDERCLYGTIFFARWIINDPQKTVCFQNDHITEMQRLRDLGPAFPTEIIDESAQITFLEDCEENDETVIACAPAQLPHDYANRTN